MSDFGNKMTDEEIKGIWHNTPTQGDSSGMKFAIAFARAVLAATPDSQGAPKQHFCEKPVGYRAVWKADGYVWHSSRIVKTAKDAESITKQWVAQEMPGCFEFEAQALYTHPSDGAQATVVGKPTPREDK